MNLYIIGCIVQKDNKPLIFSQSCQNLFNIYILANLLGKGIHEIESVKMIGYKLRIRC